MSILSLAFTQLLVMFSMFNRVEVYEDAMDIPSLIFLRVISLLCPFPLF